MGRPPLPIGTYGKVSTRSVRGGFEARARFRDYDGVTRPVARVGRTEGIAVANLKVALRDRGRIASDGDITSDTRVRVVAMLWLREIDESNLAIRTKTTYREVWDNLLDDPTGDLCVRDVRVSVADRTIRAIRKNNGSGRAKHAKIVLSGVMGLAVRHDALDDNPVRELAPERRQRGKVRKIVLTVPTMARLRWHMHESEIARTFDLVDIVDVESGVGCRIGELLALDWSKISFKRGTIEIVGTVIRVKGVGLIIQSHTKSLAGMRTIAPPSWVMDVLRRRFEERRCEWVFPSVARDTLRDPDNTRARLRDVVEGTEWVGLHPHAFRHFVATQLEAAGMTAREIADYLGHDKISVTQDEYLDRHIAVIQAGALPEITPIDPNESGE